ncbi:MAG TPA: hypothetical protein PKH77_22570 [Anaerolineae bacterium]|nr:hypothetical protein [Anaerolineae bacterium]
MLAQLRAEYFKFSKRWLAKATVICVALLMSDALLAGGFLLIKEAFRALGADGVTAPSGLPQLLENAYGYLGLAPDTLAGGRLLPYVLYSRNGPRAFLIQLLIIVSLVNLIEVGNYRNATRVLLGHGLPRIRYILTQGIFLLGYLLGLRLIAALFTIALAEFHTYLLRGCLDWQAGYWIHLARVVVGNALYDFFLASLMYMVIMMFRSPVAGLFGGVLYVSFFEALLFSLLYEKPSWQPYTSFGAAQTLLQLFPTPTGPEILRAMGVFLVGGWLWLALAGLYFNRCDFG